MGSHVLKTVIHNSDKLTQPYSGPTRSDEMRSTSQYYSRNANSVYSPVIEIDDDSHSRFITDSQKKSHNEDGEDSEAKREEFRHPRNCLLNSAADFYKLCSGKLNEINKAR